MDTSRYRGQQDRIERRRQVQRLLDLAEHLDASDRLLVEHVYRHGRPISELAKIVHRPPRALQLRLARLLKRMSTTEFQFMTRASHTLNPPTRSVARRVICQGQSYRCAAAQLHVTIHHVRTHMTRFRHALRRRLAATDPNNPSPNRLPHGAPATPPDPPSRVFNNY